MIKIKEMVIATIILIIYIIVFVLMIDYALNEELKVVAKQELEYLKYIEDNKQEGVKYEN